MCGPQKQFHPSPPLSRCTVAWLPGKQSPVAWTSIALSLSLIAQPFPAQERSPEAIALVPIDGFQAVGFPVLVIFLQKPKSSDLVGRGERIDYLCLASFPFEDARVTRM